MGAFIYNVAVNGKKNGYYDIESALENFLLEVMHGTPGSIIEYWKEWKDADGERFHYKSVKVCENTDFEEVA